MKVKITELEFDWDYPPGDPVAPDHDLYSHIGEEVEIPDDDEVLDFLTELIDTNFPITKLQWEVVEG
jgi:hypothetical protein